MESNNAGFQELIKKIILLIDEGINDFTHSEEFLEEIREINKEMVERCGRFVVNIAMLAEVITEEMETIDEDQPAQKSIDIRKINVVTAKDRAFLQEMNISAGEEEIKELQADLEKVFKEGGDLAIDDGTQQTDGVSASSSEANDQAEVLIDPRPPKEIIDSILAVACKLVGVSRLFFAQHLNTNSGGLMPRFPVSKQLADDKFWLSKITELIKALVGTNKDNAVLLSLEAFLKEIYKVQEGGK